MPAVVLPALAFTTTGKDEVEALDVVVSVGAYTCWVYDPEIAVPNWSVHVSVIVCPDTPDAGTTPTNSSVKTPAHDPPTLKV